MRSPTSPLQNEPPTEIAFKNHVEYFSKVIDCILFGVTGTLALTAAIFFTVPFVKMRLNCILFGKMFELKRIVIPGSGLPCWFYTMSLYGIAILAFALAVKAGITSSFMFNSIRSKIIAAFIPFVLLVNFFLIREGLQSLCDSFDVNKICESEVFRNTDFKAFTPKHLDAGGFYDDCQRAMYFSAVIFILWITSVLVHCRKHKRALISISSNI